MNLPGQAIAIILAVFIGGLDAVQSDEPRTARDYYERGLIRERDKDVGGALAYYGKAVELDPSFLDAWFTRSALYAEQKEYAKAIADLNKVIEIRPGDYPALFNRGGYRAELRDYDGAIADYSEILKSGADFSRSGESREVNLASTYHYRGRAYHWYKRDYPKALADYTEALRLYPDISDISTVYYLRGNAHHESGEYAKAEQDYRAALDGDPDYHDLLCRWAWQLATCPDPKFRDGKRAVEMAARANEKWGWRIAEHVDTLAAAYAEVGRFDEAIKWQERALQRLGDRKPKQREAMQERLGLYREKRPFREPFPR